MPHATFRQVDLEALCGESDLSLDRIEELCLLVKGELKRKGCVDGDVKVELQDTNRPDTWCVEGIARQIRQHKTGVPGDYACFEPPAVGQAPSARIQVAASVKSVRPYVAGFLARGYTVDEDGLQAFIAAQEVLCHNFGRQRKSVAIGIYDASQMTFPIHYEAVDAASEERAFVPLQPNEDDPCDGSGTPIPAERWAQPWTPAEILRDHPTGRKYADAIPDPSRATILVDDAGQVLSFPPVINSATLGRVQPGMSELFVEVTGTVLDQVLLAANILAANLADRGAQIEACETHYPWETERGAVLPCPHLLEDRTTVTVTPDRFGALLGEPELGSAEICDRLRHYGVKVASEANALRVTTLPYRADYLHQVDAIEDFAISRGYDTFAPLLPEEFTVGSQSIGSQFEDLIRDRMIGVGFEEAIGNILTSAVEVRERMLLPAEGPVPEFRPVHGANSVRIQNVMSVNYSLLRDWLLPTLLEIEGHSSGARNPHRVFEVGEVCSWDETQVLASQTRQHLGALLADDKQAGFSECQAYLHALLHTLGLSFGEGEGTYGLDLVEHPSFLPSRAAWVVIGAARTRIGLIGEVHPGVLEAWRIYSPVSAFEICLDTLRALLD
ncbi:MAG: phenylalanine--tRNA ligase subunit beta [Planctomycetes bacterium]|nr:phenylalanine--tRNA ligase subunit beta [Planctomycetota bacterium]